MAVKTTDQAAQEKDIPAAVGVLSDAEAFANAFDEQLEPASAADQVVADQVAADAAAVAAADAAKDDAGDDAATDQVAADAAADQVAADAAKDDTADQVADTVDYKAEFERLKVENEVLKTAPKPKPEPVAEPAQDFKMPDPPTAKSVLTDEEMGVVTAYDDEWPDVSKAEALKRKVDIAVMEDRIYREVATALQGVLGTVNPIVQSVQQTANQKHYATIEAAHPDYLAVVAEIDGWIEKQPAYLKKAMSEVLDSGSAVEVNDLFARFKQETGRVAPQVKTDQPLLKKVDAATVQAMAPVTAGRRQAVTSATDPNDFGGAWANAAQE